MLEQSVQDLQNDLVKMRQASAQVMASTKQLEKRAEQADTQSQVRTNSTDDVVCRYQVIAHSLFETKLNLSRLFAVH